MEENLISNLINICKVLNKHGVEYLVIGGAAVTIYSHFRPSINAYGLPSTIPDIDFWYNPTYTNYFKLLDTIEDLGQDVSAFREEQVPDPKKSFFRYNFDEFTIDFLPLLKAPLNFAHSFRQRNIIKLEETDILVLSYDDLLIDKETSSRPKDRIDLEQLRKARKK